MGKTNDSVDLLLMNSSNLPFIPVFPYAFVQVGALARRRGLKIKTLDLVKLSEEQILPTVGDEILSNVVDGANRRAAQAPSSLPSRSACPVAPISV
jgi:hypothetical protein